MFHKPTPVVLLENCTGGFSISEYMIIYYVHRDGGLWRKKIGVHRDGYKPDDGDKLDANCAAAPHLYGEAVYFQAGKHGLYRRSLRFPPDPHEKSVRLDPNCAGTPLVHDLDKGHVYFCGGGSDDQLHRVKLQMDKDGDLKAAEVEDLKARCSELGFVHNNWLYYRYKDELFRLNLADPKTPKDRKKITDGLSAPTLVDLGPQGYKIAYRGQKQNNDLLLLTLSSGGEPIGKPARLDENCESRPYYHGGYVYFSGYMGRLYRRACSGSVPSEPLAEKCNGMPIVVGGYVYYQADGRLLQQPLSSPRRPGHDWMSQMKEDIGARELWQIALPGAHDAGCYDEFWVTRDQLSHQHMGNSKAQGKSIGEQLRYGIRYFDLRFTPNPKGSGPQTKSLKQYNIFHGPHLSVVTLDDVIGDIANFLQADKDRREILILDLRAGGLAKEEELFVMREMCNRIGKDRIVGRSAVAKLQKNGVRVDFPAHCTPNELCPRQVIILWWGGYDKELSVDNPPACEYADYMWFYSDKRNIKTDDAVMAPDFSDTDHAYFQIRDSKYGPYGEDALELSMKWWTDHHQGIQKNSHFKYWLREGLNVRPTPWVANVSLLDWAEKSLPILIANLTYGGKWNRSDVYNGNGVCEQHRFPWGVISQDLFHESHYTDFVEAVISLNERVNQFDYSSGRRRRA